MAKVVVTQLNRSKKKKLVDTELSTQKARDAEGVVRALYSLDAGSAKFALEFGKAFNRSVSRARRENKRVTGSTDVVPAKG